MSTATRTRSAVEQEHYPTGMTDSPTCAADNHPWPCPVERERRRADLAERLVNISRRSAELTAALPHVGFNLAAGLAQDVPVLLRVIDDLNRRIREAAGATSRVDPFDGGLVAVRLAEIRAILTGGNQ